jgi:hypothetical protein
LIGPFSSSDRFYAYNSRPFPQARLSDLTIFSLTRGSVSWIECARVVQLGQSLRILLFAKLGLSLYARRAIG